MFAVLPRQDKPTQLHLLATKQVYWFFTHTLFRKYQRKRENWKRHLQSCSPETTSLLVTSLSSSSCFISCTWNVPDGTYMRPENRPLTPSPSSPPHRFAETVHVAVGAGICISGSGAWTVSGGDSVESGPLSASVAGLSGEGGGRGTTRHR